MCHLLQVKNTQPSVTKRYYHSMSTAAVSHNCAWLMVIGDDYPQADFVLLELSEWHNETETRTQCILMRCCCFLWLLNSVLCCFFSSDAHTHTHTHTHEHKHIHVLSSNSDDGQFSVGLY